MTDALWVVGGGGHAKVVIDAARRAGDREVAGVLDDDSDRWGETVLGVPIAGAATPETIARLGVRNAVLAIGDNRSRCALAQRLAGAVAWRAVRHPSAVVAESARVESGAVIFAGAVVQPEAVIGAHAIVNTLSGVDHDARIGPFAHVAPGAHLAGGVVVEEGALVGIGASVNPGLTIGAWAVVGAGAAVTQDVPAGVTAMGVPARWT